MIETLEKVSGVDRDFLTCVSGLVITAKLLASLPVPAVVVTSTIGSASPAGCAK